MTAATTAKLRETHGYKIAKRQLADREWRLDHLYYIKDKDGNEVPFNRNTAQRLFSSAQWYRDAILKARQLGFSTDIAIKIADTSVFRPGTVSAIVDYKLPDAVKKLDKIRFAYERLPRTIRETVTLEKDNEGEMRFSNGSSVTVGTSYRGDTPQILHISEYGKISTDNPTQAKEIKTGAIQAVGLNGKIYVESTAHGVAGEFYDLVQTADTKKKTGATLTKLDFKLHFYGWHVDPTYRIPNNTVIIPQEVEQYFYELRASHGLIVDANQVAWYVKKLEDLGPDDIKSEYPSIPEECFFNSLEGAYFKRELSRAKIDKRIGQHVPYDPTRVVHTCGDIGVDDEQAIWFFQSDGVRYRFIDYASASGEGLMHYIRTLKDRQDKRGFIYGTHYGPHDLGHQDWSNINAESRVEVAAGFGIKFKVVPRVKEKGEAIEAARRMIQSSWFDSVHCAEGVRALENYRKTWNEKLATYSMVPVHDWASHGADALMTGAMGYVPDPTAKAQSGDRGQQGSAWSA